MDFVQVLFIWLHSVQTLITSIIKFRKTLRTNPSGGNGSTTGNILNLKKNGWKYVGKTVLQIKERVKTIWMKKFFTWKMPSKILASGKTRVSTRTWRARVMGKRRADLRDQFLMGKDARALAARHLYCPEKKIVRIWRARDMGKWRADLREEFFVGKDARFKIFKIFQIFKFLNFF